MNVSDADRPNTAPRTERTPEPQPKPTPTATPTPAATPAAGDSFQTTPLNTAAAPDAPAHNPRDEAVAGARAFLHGAERAGVRDGNGATTYSDPENVNARTDTDPASARHQQATALVEANRPLEEAALAAMPEEQRAQYEQVRTAVQAAGDPVAELSLQTMLLEGKLPGAEDLVGEGTLLGNLATLADEQTPLAEGVDRGALLTDVIQEVAVPPAIAQHNKNTCTATAVSIQLAMDNPAEYARLATGLASPEGQVTLASGTVLQREEGTIAEQWYPDSEGNLHLGRSASQRLMEPAFMEVSNGLLNYDDTQDKHLLGPIPTVPGALGVMVDGLLEAIYDKPMEHRTGILFGVMDELERQTEAGHSVLVTLDWEDNDAPMMWHKVLVTGFETVDGQEYVKYTNPWGQQERMPRDEFERRLREANWDPSVGRPAPQAPAQPAAVPAPEPVPTPEPQRTPTPEELIAAERRRLLSRA